MTTARMKIIFDMPDESAGIPAADLNGTVQCVQNAVRLMAAHLAGVDTPGRPPEWLRRQTALRVLEASAETRTVALGLSPADVRDDGENSDGEHYGAAALDAVLGWKGRGDRVLPRAVSRQLSDIGRRLSPDVSCIWLCDIATGMQISIGRDDAPGVRRVVPGAGDSKPEEAVLYGRLQAVNWQLGVAHLYRTLEPPVVLRFEASESQLMLLLATRYVKVKGVGRIDANGQWGPVKVSEITAEWSVVDELYARKPKIFDPEKATSFYQDDGDDPVDIEEFIRVIYEARDR